MFPDWLNHVFDDLPGEVDDSEPSRWQQGTVDFESGEQLQRGWNKKQIASLITREVCHECNTGWMHDLEDRAAPILKPMIRGNPHTLDLDQQIIVATWATKTAMVIEPTLDRRVNFSLEQRQIVMNDDRPPGPFRVRAAAIEDMIPPLRYSCVRGQVQRNGAPFFDFHYYTLQIHVLVLQVIRTEPPPPNFGALKELAVPTDFEVPLFPPIDGFFWPPKDSFNNETLNQYVGRLQIDPP